MQYEGTTYRPPPEADTPLLQVTVGCAHNRCTFCNMYRDVNFRVISMDRVENDLKEIHYIFNRVERFFLVNGDAFVLSVRQLKQIAEKINKIFPECQTISMYASIRNIQTKTDAELRELKDLGINDLYIGVESGSDTVLSNINKGNTVAEAKIALQRITEAGIDHISNVILGAAGANKGLENAEATAAFINETQPKMIWMGSLAVFKGTELYNEIQSGLFKQATEMEILQEEQAFIQQLKLENVRILGQHPTNTIPIGGVLPGDKQKMIQMIDEGIKQMSKAQLLTVFNRAIM